MKFSGGKMIVAGAVVGGALLATVMPVMADVAGESPSVGAVRIESPAKLKALGAAVEVQVTVACTAGTSGYVNLNVTQNSLVGGGIASGSAYKSINCTGQFETYTFHVTATGKAFRWGTAYGTAQLHGWPNSAHDEREIKLVP